MGTGTGIEGSGGVVPLDRGQAPSATEVAALGGCGEGWGALGGGLALLQAFALPCSGVPAPLHTAVVPPPPPGLQHP